jgi:hypothetical protein
MMMMIARMKAGCRVRGKRAGSLRCLTHIQTSVPSGTCTRVRRYTPLRVHASLFQPELAWPPSAFHPEFLEAVAGGPATIAALARQECPGVYSLPMLSPELCGQLMQELRHFEGTDLPKSRPNSMNNYVSLFGLCVFVWVVCVCFLGVGVGGGAVACLVCM